MQQQLRMPGTCCHGRLATSGIRHLGQARRSLPVHNSSSSSRGTVLVDGLVVQPAYRSTPWAAEQQQALHTKDKALILFVSESGICRGPLAAALFQNMLQSSPLKHWIQVKAKASRDYCIGQQPHPAAAAAVLAAAAADDDDQAGSSSSGAVQFDPAADIVAADLVLVMDKYTAADVLREVSSYDLINPGGHYSARVRLLGSFHPILSQRVGQADAQDIDDPLYGNLGGEQEQAAVLAASKLIFESCNGLLQQLQGLADQHGLLEAAAAAATAETLDHPAAAETLDNTASSSSSNNDTCSRQSASAGAVFRQLLVHQIRSEGVISWMVPPMLQGSTTDLGGWV